LQQFLDRLAELSAAASAPAAAPTPEAIERAASAASQTWYGGVAEMTSSECDDWRAVARAVAAALREEL
jgi:hypothetical protein